MDVATESGGAPAAVHNNSFPAAPFRPPRAKRVNRACDYCREKRLKCTVGTRCCMNCQLYGAECTYSKEPRQHTTTSLGEKKRTKRRVGLSRPYPGAEEELRVPDGSEVQSEQAGSANFDQHTHQQQPPHFDMNVQRDASDAHAEQIDFGNLSSSFQLGSPFDFWNPSHDNMLFPPDQDLERLSSMLNDVRATGVMLSDTDQCLGVDSNLGGLPTGRSIESSNDGKVSGVHSLKPNGGQSMAQERIPPGLFIRKDSVNSNFIGLNSTGATIAICLRESLERAHSLSKFPSFDFLIDAGSHVDEAGVAHTVDLSVLELPPRLLAIRAIDVFFANVNIVHPIINEDDFRGISERLYTGHRTASTPLELSIFYLITAIGSLCEPENSEMSEQSSRGLYQQAWLLFNDCIAAPSVATVQVLLLHVIFHLQFGKGGIAWVICGLAVRTAQSMGLHRRSPRDFDLSEAQIRLRSQIWWVSFCLDAFVSMTQARPTAVSNSMYDTELTHPDLQHHTSPPLAAMASNLYTWRIKLAQIQNSFCGILNRSETIVARLDSLAELDTTLTSWRDEIQIDCRPEQEILVHNSVYPFIALLHLEYFNIMRAIHWAVMTGLPAKEYDANTHPSVRIRASEAICLGAARSFVKTLNNVADTTGNRKLVPISFQTDYYMAAIAVLYRGIFKQPQSLSAKTDLEYFRAGKIHLVRDIHEMNLSSTLRNLFDEMLASAEALLYQ